MKQSVPTMLGLSALLADGGPLRNLKGHASRIADEIADTSLEVGGQPWSSPRYRDASAVVHKVIELEKIADGTYQHPDLSPQALDLTDNVLDDVRRERERQVRRGYDAAHDDRHGDQAIAHEASMAIWPRDEAAYPCPPGGRDWVGLHHDRRTELIKGIALAVAEVERLDRAAPKDFEA